MPRARLEGRRLQRGSTDPGPRYQDFLVFFFFFFASRGGEVLALVLGLSSTSRLPVGFPADAAGDQGLQPQHMGVVFTGSPLAHHTFLPHNHGQRKSSAACRPHAAPTSGGSAREGCRRPSCPGALLPALRLPRPRAVCNEVLKTRSNDVRCSSGARSRCSRRGRRGGGARLEALVRRADAQMRCPSNRPLPPPALQGRRPGGARSRDGDRRSDPDSAPDRARLTSAQLFWHLGEAFDAKQHLQAILRLQPQSVPALASPGGSSSPRRRTRSTTSSSRASGASARATATRRRSSRRRGRRSTPRPPPPAVSATSTPRWASRASAR